VLVPIKTPLGDVVAGVKRRRPQPRPPTANYRDFSCLSSSRGVKANKGDLRRVHGDPDTRRGSPPPGNNITEFIVDALSPMQCGSRTSFKHHYAGLLCWSMQVWRCEQNTPGTASLTRKRNSSETEHAPVIKPVQYRSIRGHDSRLKLS
jgi:hypothetical protein